MAMFKEESFYRAIILQAFADLTNNSPKVELTLAREEAKRWLLNNSKDFNFICDAAGYSPDYVRNKAIEVLTTGRKFRAANGTGARYLENKQRKLKLERLYGRDNSKPL